MLNSILNMDARDAADLAEMLTWGQLPPVWKPMLRAYDVEPL